MECSHIKSLSRRCIILFICLVRASCRELPHKKLLGFEADHGIQSADGGYLEDFDGTRYALADLIPLEKDFVPYFGRLGHLASTQTVFKANFGLVTSLLAQTDEEGTILYVELRRSGLPTIYYVKTAECLPAQLMVFSSSDLVRVDNIGQFFGDVEDDDELFVALPVEPSATAHSSSEASESTVGSTMCQTYKILQVGIVYDAEFCQLYGSHKDAEAQIEMIVAGASLLYEGQMCVKVRLADIYTPDSDCNGESIFANMHRDNACGRVRSTTPFIISFRDWMNDKRQGTALDPSITYHAFTGFSHRGVRGCAYRGTTCVSPEFDYGVNYMNSNLVSTQSVIFAHELAHNLNATHLPSSGSSRYIMKPTVQNPNDGFSEQTIHSIQTWLDVERVMECVEIEVPQVPTHLPSLLPTRTPTSLPLPTTRPSPIPSSPPSLPECSTKSKENSAAKLCVMALEDESMYGCFRMTDMARQVRDNGCFTGDSGLPRLEFLRCTRIQDADISNDESEDPNTDWDDSYVKYPAREDSNDEGLDFFHVDGSSCISMPECVRVGEHICVQAWLEDDQDSTSYKATFSVTGGMSKMVDVKMNVSRLEAGEDETCREANTMCLDTL